MNNKSDKKKDDELRREAADDRAASNAALTTASQPSVLQAMREGEVTNWLNWRNRTGDYKDKPLDIREAPGFGPQIALYNDASADRQNARQGRGLIQMGANATSPEYAANLATQDQLRRDETRAGRLENAFAVKDAEMTNSAIPMMELTQARNMGIAGLRTGQAQQSQGLWGQYRVRPGWGAGVLQGLAQGAGAAGAAFAGSPTGSKTISGWF